jgi:hypothetical protein
MNKTVFFQTVARRILCHEVSDSQCEKHLDTDDEVGRYFRDNFNNSEEAMVALVKWLSEQE